MRDRHYASCPAITGSSTDAVCTCSSIDAETELLRQENQQLRENLKEAQEIAVALYVNASPFYSSVVWADCDMPEGWRSKIGEWDNT